MKKLVQEKPQRRKASADNFATLSPAFIPNCRLQDFLRSYPSQDTCCVNHVLLNVMDHTDRVQISLSLPQAVSSWASLGNSQQVHRQPSCLTPTWCSKVHAFMIPVILSSGSGLGVCKNSKVRNPPANAGNTRSIPGLGRSPGGGNGNPLQYSCLGNPTDRGAWWTTVHGVAKSQTGLSY